MNLKNELMEGIKPMGNLNRRVAKLETNKHQDTSQVWIRYAYREIDGKAGEQKAKAALFSGDLSMRVIASEPTSLTGYSSGCWRSTANPFRQ
jgi:hypothetical protein